MLKQQSSPQTTEYSYRELELPRVDCILAHAKMPASGFEDLIKTIATNLRDGYQKFVDGADYLRDALLSSSRMVDRSSLKNEPKNGPFSFMGDFNLHSSTATAVGVATILGFFSTTTDIKAGNVTLAWDASPTALTDATANIAGTNTILIGTQSGLFPLKLRVARNAVQCTVSNVVPGVTYYFAVNYSNETGVSGPSNEISYTAPANAPAPVGTPSQRALKAVEEVPFVLGAESPIDLKFYKHNNTFIIAAFGKPHTYFNFQASEKVQTLENQDLGWSTVTQGRINEKGYWWIKMPEELVTKASFQEIDWDDYYEYYLKYESYFNQQQFHDDYLYQEPGTEPPPVELPEYEIPPPYETKYKAVLNPGMFFRTKSYDSEPAPPPPTPTMKGAQRLQEWMSLSTWNLKLSEDGPPPGIPLGQ